jgi:hypothetical protein
MEPKPQSASRQCHARQDRAPPRRGRATKQALAVDITLLPTLGLASPLGRGLPPYRRLPVCSTLDVGLASEIQPMIRITLLNTRRLPSAIGARKKPACTHRRAQSATPTTTRCERASSRSSIARSPIAVAFDHREASLAVFRTVKGLRQSVTPSFSPREYETTPRAEGTGPGQDKSPKLGDVSRTYQNRWAFRR